MAQSNLVQGNGNKALLAAEHLSKIDEIAGLRMQAEIYCHLLGNCSRAVEIYEELEEKDSNHFNYKQRYAYSLWMVGQEHRALKMLETQKEMYESEISLGRAGRNDPRYNLAGMHAFLGNKELAYKYLHEYTFLPGWNITFPGTPCLKICGRMRSFKNYWKKLKKTKLKS